MAPLPGRHPRPGSGDRHHRRLCRGAGAIEMGGPAGIPILWTIGIILIAVGAVLTILGATGRAI
jgi:hypothetical protein